MIETVSLKRYGHVTAVDDLSFAARPGYVTGFPGPNGAGKTTTTRLILGLDLATSGTALVRGRRYQGVVRPLHEVGALLDANAALPAHRAVTPAVARAEQRDRPPRGPRGAGSHRPCLVAHRRVRGFSLGMKQRLGIAAALLGDPPVLMFDEPVNGLDPEGIHWIRQLLQSLAAEGRTVFVSSHVMSEMALTADHLIVIGRGRLLADMPTEALIQSGARRDVLVRSPRGGDLARLLTAHGAAVMPEDRGALTVTGMDAPAIAGLAAAQAIPVTELRFTANAAHELRTRHRRSHELAAIGNREQAGPRPGPGHPAQSG